MLKISPSDHLDYLFYDNIYSEIDQNSAGISQNMENCKDYALERKKNLEEETERFQKAAYTVLEMLNNREIR